MSFVRQESREIKKTLRSFLKWILIAHLTGAAGGLVGSAFHLSVSWATGFRAAHPWMLYLLPAAGLVIGLIYHFLHTENKNTNTIIDSVQLGERVPLALTLGTGYKGGEVVPCFFVGATFGCTVGGLLGLPAGFAAAVGLVCVFCGAVNCPLASILLAVELFGSGNLAYYGLACGIAYMLSGYFGLYSSQKIMYSKLKAEFINIHAR